MIRKLSQWIKNRRTSAERIKELEDELEALHADNAAPKKKGNVDFNNVRREALREYALLVGILSETRMNEIAQDRLFRVMERLRFALCVIGLAYQDDDPEFTSVIDGDSTPPFYDPLDEYEADDD